MSLLAIISHKWSCLVIKPNLWLFYISYSVFRNNSSCFFHLRKDISNHSFLLLLDSSNLKHPLFPNRQGGKLSRMAVLNIIKKYAAIAKIKHPELILKEIGYHSFTHSKTVHMMEADINLAYIRDFLGHSSTTITEVYVKASEKKTRSTDKVESRYNKKTIKYSTKKQETSWFFKGITEKILIYYVKFGRKEVSHDRG